MLQFWHRAGADTLVPGLSAQPHSLPQLLSFVWSPDMVWISSVLSLVNSSSASAGHGGNVLDIKQGQC